VLRTVVLLVVACLFSCVLDAAQDSHRTTHRSVPSGPANIPLGSYQESCTDIEMRDGHLRATCQNVRGLWIKTELYDPSRCAIDIANWNGELSCYDSAPPPRDWERTIGQFQHTAWGPKDGAPSVVTALAQSADGYLWLGSSDGLYRFDGVVFEHYQPQSGGPFPAQGVLSLLTLPNGDLWIGFRSGPISLLRHGNATNYSVREGVPKDGYGASRRIGKGGSGLRPRAGSRGWRATDGGR
jgi:hypothetical protein